MTNASTKNEAFKLSLEGEKVRNAKFYYTSGCTREGLNDFHKKAWAQVKNNVSKPDNDFDIHLLD